MEQFFTDWFFEIIFFALAGIFLIGYFLKKMAEKDKEIEDLYKKHKPK